MIERYLFGYSFEKFLISPFVYNVLSKERVNQLFVYILIIFVCIYNIVKPVEEIGAFLDNLLVGV